VWLSEWVGATHCASVADATSVPRYTLTKHALTARDISSLAALADLRCALFVRGLIKLVCAMFALPSHNTRSTCAKDAVANRSFRCVARVVCCAVNAALLHAIVLPGLLMLMGANESRCVNKHHRLQGTLKRTNRKREQWNIHEHTYLSGRTRE
jgi:hypothetical protein